MQSIKVKGVRHIAIKKKKKIPHPPQLSVEAAEQNISEIHLNKDICIPPSDLMQRTMPSAMTREDQVNFSRQHHQATNANLWLDLSQPPPVGAHTSLIADSFQLQAVQANSFSPGIYQIHNPNTTIPINQQGHLNMLQFESIHAKRLSLLRSLQRATCRLLVGSWKRMRYLILPFRRGDAQVLTKPSLHPCVIDYSTVHRDPNRGETGEARQCFPWDSTTVKNREKKRKKENIFGRELSAPCRWCFAIMSQVAMADPPF
ncbi:hypothetical protein HPP92_016418 [Vanilla planifolia]|uniref:Uncharacterized protein n=1 Tax=Vanilla planifolia TaxID=51239 RepID=A0A835QN39_VANPL|nr:hypothetical protein HPP92_016418 [Vanilla planifolia]